MSGIMNAACCCGTIPSYPCQPCPPGTGHEWIVQILQGGIIGDSAGNGIVGFLDFRWPECATVGSCGRQTFRRKAVGNTDFMDVGCEDQVCESIIDDAAAYGAGDHTIRWSFCSSVFPFDPPGSPYLPDILNDQQGDVYIDAVLPNLRWNFGTCTYEGPSETDCATIIVVRFTYSDTFQFPVWNSDIDGCYSYLATATMPTQTWTCYYVRQVATGQYFAEGAYSLLRCDYPAPYDTYEGGISGGLCSFPDGTVCSTQYGVSTLPPTTWKPPVSINLVRLS